MQGEARNATLCGSVKSGKAAFFLVVGVAHPVGLAGGDDDGGVVQQPVEDAGGGVFGQEPSPLLERPVSSSGANPISSKTTRSARSSIYDRDGNFDIELYVIRTTRKNKVPTKIEDSRVLRMLVSALKIGRGRK